MAYYVCSGAKLKCSMGSQESDLSVLHPVKPVNIEGNPMACMMDHKPFVNIKPFGQCQSLANPTVAAATAANYGRLQKMPCIPNTTTPWIGAKMNVFVKGNPAILDNSKLMCMWAGVIEVTNPGQKSVKEGGTPLNLNLGAVKSEKQADGVDVIVGSDGNTEEAAEAKELKYITVKDFADILKEIESKQSYEAARHYASNHIDYWKINLLAKRYVLEDDEEKKEKEKDNDPNLMPSRFMILYGAEDGKLKSNGNLDDYRDGFENEGEHKMSVAKIREALRTFGCSNIEETGPFDEYVYFAFLDKHLRKYSRVDIDGYLNGKKISEDAATDDFASEHGVFTWRYFEDQGHERDHDIVAKELNPKLGDELLVKKGKEKGIEIVPMMFMPGIVYHYPWVPFHGTII